MRSFVCAFLHLCVRSFVCSFLRISRIPFFSQVVGSFVRSVGRWFVRSFVRSFGRLFGRSFVCISRKFDIKKSTFLDTNVREK